MTNDVVTGQANQSPVVFVPSKVNGKTCTASSTKAGRRANAGRRERGALVDQFLLSGLLDPKTSALPFAVLTEAAVLLGKRLILEIRDENPVQVVWTSTRGM